MADQPATAPTWYDSQHAKSELNMTVTDKGLTAAREQCLRAKGLALDTATPPSESFAQGVVLQALANRQATQAGTDDETGGQSNGVRLYPLSRQIMALLIIPDPTEGGHDGGLVGSLVG